MRLQRGRCEDALGADSSGTGGEPTTEKRRNFLVFSNKRAIFYLKIKLRSNL
jgi:hypothetical protein